MSDDLTPEDAELLSRYLAGPGARPNADDRSRWLQAARNGDIPRIVRPRRQPIKPEWRGDE